MRFKSSTRNSGEGKEVLSMEGPGLLCYQGLGSRLGGLAPGLIQWGLTSEEGAR